jgi:Dolichyl-phosphate-mannose-protein mannosyltransferase
MAQAASRDVDTEPPPYLPDAVHRAARRFLPRLAVASPELVAAAVAGFSLGPMIALLAGSFTAPLAVPLGLVGAAVAMWVCGVPAERTTQRTVLFTVAAALVTLAWFVYNVRYYAQDVYATRDPATYGIAARWLMDHSSLNIPVHTEVFGTPSGSTLDASGFQVARLGILHAQGNHLLPALMSLAGSTFGTTALLQANVAIGALALFVFFGLARRIVGAPLALLVMTSLAVSMPFVYVSRDAYSEPLMMLFLLGGLALLHRAITSGRVADFALAGFVVACSAMVRIDSYGALLAVVFAAIAVVAIAGVGRRRAAALRAAAMIAGGVPPILVGWLDLTQLSRLYFAQLHSQITLQLVALVALLVVGPAIAWLGWRPALRARLAADDARRRIAIGAAFVVVAAFAFLASRPLWQETHAARVNVNLENMQRESRVAIDGTRLYNEQSVNWQAMYFGWPTVVLAVAGYAVLVAALVRHRCYALVGTLVMGLIMSGLYLWDCQIVADQPWASRRFVPVVIPLLLVAAAAVLRALWSWQRALVWARALAVVAGALMVAVPASITQPMAQVRDEAGQLRQLRAICAAVGSDGAVVELDRDTKAGYGQAIRSYCGVPTIALVGATPPQLASMRIAAVVHGRTLFVLSQDPATTHYATSGAVAPFSSVTVQRWPNIINKAPTAPSLRATVVFLSTVDNAGLAHPVPAAR